MNFPHQLFNMTRKWMEASEQWRKITIRYRSVEQQSQKWVKQLDWKQKIQNQA